MFLAANPDKAKPAEEKEAMRAKYKPRDNVLPKVRIEEKSPEERRIEEMERRMLEQAREMSLRDVGVESSLESRRVRRHHEHSNSEDARSRSDRESSRDTRHRDRRDRSRRRDDRRRRAEVDGPLQTDLSSDERRRQRGASQNESRDSSRVRRRHVEHQASIRSLISASDVDSLDLEREIEDFARHIQEEGLLDGLDLDNIDELSRNDELSRKITEAYRRRQRERARQEPRRSHISVASRQSESAHSAPRPSLIDATHSGNRRRSSSANTGPSGSTTQREDRSRPPVTAAHLEVRNNPERRYRRRTSSGGRSATDPIVPSVAETRPAARSQTDLTLPSQSNESMPHRQWMAEFRSSSTPAENSHTQPPGDNSGDRGLPFSARATAAQNLTTSPTDSPFETTNHNQAKRTRRPSDLVAPQAPLPSLGLVPASPTPHHHRARSQFYQEPSISCLRCGRAHIEYELHYNCSQCREGNWNLCLGCYRAGKGCFHWFGFGHAAWKKWERARAAGNDNLEPPHMLTSNRYNPPKYVPGGAEGRRTMTTDDPARRLESGAFCSRCFAWANECFWRCEVCNEGDWGFCNKCVNQGHCCTHPLLPLAYVPPPQQQQASSRPNNTPPGSPPRSPGRPPPSATLLTGPNAPAGIGNFKPLTFTTTCDVCRGAIPPAQHRYHCFACVSHVVPDTLPGDYDICSSCYAGLVSKGRVAPENGAAGWRRCPRGHRMAVIGFEEGRDGRQRRHVVRDIVGGVGLRTESYETPSGDDNDGARDGDEDGRPTIKLEKWSWHQGPDGARLERLVAVDVAAPAPPQLRLRSTGNATATDELFPPEGGAGMRAVATWSWYPQPGADDELAFPRGAEVREVEDVNGDWFHGSYMGAMGLFPSPYVRVFER
ncbi:hypothetical protein DL764_007899 [Monosporascus ibericus]|uniref:SH3 domain-containing protein n=1 Tax=Monosporascus ibericus TaxID=155417 RepID=A0A4V1X9E8_9PEZI|nr:hypothetical protein DL764_007899 [Monosporascus ibericus]